MALRNYLFLLCLFCQWLFALSTDAPSLSEVELPTLANIGGQVPEDIQRVINYIKSLHVPAKVKSSTERIRTINTSILLYGPPGTGKTTLAQVIAGESGCAFFSIPLQRLYNNYLGTGSKTIEDTFIAARSLGKPAVIFCDEIDTLCHDGDRKQRSDEVNTAFDTLLIEIEKCNKSKERSILFIGATNRIQNIDPAVASRLGTKIAVGLPDFTQRYHVFRHCLKEKNIPLCPFVVCEIVEEMEGFSNRDIVNYIDNVNGIPVDTLKAVHFRQTFIKFKADHQSTLKKDTLSSFDTCVHWAKKGLSVAQLALSGFLIFKGAKNSTVILQEAKHVVS